MNEPHRTRSYALSDGGELAVSTWSGDAPPVLAIHGIGSTSRLWYWLKAADDGLSIIAPDLRGRGASPAGPGSSSLARHAEDLVEMLDQLDIDSIDVVGMSMGGFVATALAATHPRRVRSVTLLDGGLPLQRDPRRPVTAEHIPVLLADRYARKEQIWTSVEEYTAFFVESTGPLLDPEDARLRAMLSHDLTQGSAGGQVRLDLDAVSADALDVFVTDTSHEAFAGLTVPTRLAIAEWSVGADSAPMYAPGYLEQFRGGHPALQEVEVVAGVDHASLIMTDRGAEHCAAMLGRSMNGR